MMRNRVDPTGNIIETKARGAWIGNRGLLHDRGTAILRPFKLKAWLICVLKFKDRRRVVMSPNQYTELFFLDEATALAAGHRPCFECRRDDANRFKAAWLKGNPVYGFDAKVPIREIDEVIHKERIDEKGGKVTFEGSINDLPDGVFIVYDSFPYLLYNNELHRWTPEGYNKGVSIPLEEKVIVLTPPSTVNALREGYRAQVGVR